MAHYYAFCTTHKKFGDNRDTASEAWADCNSHAATPGNHGSIYVKLSTTSRVENGKKVFRYRKFRKP